VAHVFSLHLLPFKSDCRRTLMISQCFAFLVCTRWSNPMDIGGPVLIIPIIVFQVLLCMHSVASSIQGNMESEPRSNFFPPPPAIRPWRAACRGSSLGRRRGSICWPPVGGPFVLCRGAEQRPSRLPPLLRIFRPPARELRPSATPAAEASQSRVEQH